MLDYRRFKEIGELFACGKTEQAKFLLMEMQSRCIALRDEMAILKARILILEESLNFARNLYFEHGLYWLKIDGIRQGPFCARCYDDNNILIRLDKADDKRICSICGEIYILAPSASISGTVSTSSKILKFIPQGSH